MHGHTSGDWVHTCVIILIKHNSWNLYTRESVTTYIKGVTTTLIAESHCGLYMKSIILLTIIQVDQEQFNF